MLMALVDLIFPRLCHCCGKALHTKERGVCRKCIPMLPRTHYHKCQDNPVEMRLAGKAEFEQATSWLFYSPDSRVARLIHDFKYRGFRLLARHLGALMARDIRRSGWLDDVDYVMGVPLHWFKLMMRGYSQTRELALGIESVSGIPLSDDLKALRHHRTQTSKSHDERLRNVEGVFWLDNPEIYSGKRVVLVDDVCTTGGTIAAAAAAINEACPDCKVRILTLATVF